jgi:hypothetical protein
MDCKYCRNIRLTLLHMYGPVIGLLLYVIISDLVLLVSFMWYTAYLLLFIDHSAEIIHICACSFTGTIAVHLLVQFWSHFGFLEHVVQMMAGTIWIKDRRTNISLIDDKERQCHIWFLNRAMVSEREVFEDTKGIIKISISKNRQHNGQPKKCKRTKNDLPNIELN